MGVIRAALVVAVGLALIAVGRLQGGAPVELEQQSLAADHPKCDAKCSQHKAMVIARMKALRKEIDGDYNAMVHFGDKAGYVPPVRSIKSQVMDGSLLGGGKGSNDAAPPPFSADVADGGKDMSSKGGLSASSILPRVGSVGQMQRKFMHSVAHKASAASSSSSPAGHHPQAHKATREASAAPVRAAPAVAHHAAHKASPVVDMFNPSVGHSVKVHGDSHHHTSRGRRSGKGSVQWDKAFAFMQNKAAKMGGSGHGHHNGDSGVPESVERHIRTKKTTEPAVVRAAMQKALSFATSSMHRSKTEQEGDKLLGLDTGGSGHHVSAKRSDPLNTKFLNSWFGA
uniref:Uncharacterized protein n=2 Tax=Hemiselmis andersenii TaxID=464988 RepID=A0A7S0TXJ3_HEMAN